MAVIAITAKTQGESLTAAQTTASTTASITADANSVLFAHWGTGLLAGSTAPNITVTGTGLTWTVVTSVLYAGSQRRRIGVAYALVGSAGWTGTLDLTPQTATDGLVWIVNQAAGADAGAVVVPGSVVTATSASAATLPITLGAALRADSRPYAMYAAASAQIMAPNTNWTEIAEEGISDVSIADHGMETQWRSAAFDTSADATWADPHACAGIAFEIAAGTMADYQQALKDSQQVIAPFIGSDISLSANAELRVISASAFAVVASIFRTLVINGFLSEADFYAALAAAEATAYPSEAP